jgi:hypothetical protein
LKEASQRPCCHLCLLPLHQAGKHLLLLLWVLTVLLTVLQHQQLMSQL